MSKKEKHINPTPDFEKQTEAFFRQAQIPFEKSKEDIWASLESKFATKQLEKTTVLKRYRIGFSIAASILILAGIFSIFRFYTTTVESLAGQHLAVNLPGGSSVILNAKTSISYHPLWWRFSRELRFEGEAFFEVEKGKKFVVNSSKGKTEVLGTSFNIFSRNDQYEVSCRTGKVKITSHTKEDAILSPGYNASINADGKVLVFKPDKPENNISWIDNKFIFTGTPFTAVIKEIERQYNVQITFPVGIEYYYTGYFTRDKPVEQVLDLVCKPFGLTFVAKHDGSFEVVQK